MVTVSPFLAVLPLLTVTLPLSVTVTFSLSQVTVTLPSSGFSTVRVTVPEPVRVAWSGLMVMVGVALVMVRSAYNTSSISL